ncbi:unnamed protein product, partial [Choristocarpus tenellus]
MWTGVWEADAGHGGGLVRRSAPVRPGGSPIPMNGSSTVQPYHSLRHGSTLQPKRSSLRLGRSQLIEGRDKGRFGVTLSPVNDIVGASSGSPRMIGSRLGSAFGGFRPSGPISGFGRHDELFLTGFSMGVQDYSESDSDSDSDASGKSVSNSSADGASPLTLLHKSSSRSNSRSSALHRRLSRAMSHRRARGTKDDAPVVMPQPSPLGVAASSQNAMLPDLLEGSSLKSSDGGKGERRVGTNKLEQRMSLVSGGEKDLEQGSPRKASISRDSSDPTPQGAETVKTPPPPLPTSPPPVTLTLAVVMSGLRFFLVDQVLGLHLPVMKLCLGSFTCVVENRLEIEDNRLEQHLLRTGRRPNHYSAMFNVGDLNAGRGHGEGGLDAVGAADAAGTLTSSLVQGSRVRVRGIAAAEGGRGVDGVDEKTDGGGRGNELEERGEMSRYRRLQSKKSSGELSGARGGL